MIAVDTNILVYAHRADSPFHDAANTCMVSLAEGAANWALPWPCLHEFLAIVGHPRIYAPPTPGAKALDQIDAWLESPTLRLLTEAEEHRAVLRGLVERARVAGPKVHDARIAALCKEHGVRELWSADRDFSPSRTFAPSTRWSKRNDRTIAQAILVELPHKRKCFQFA